MSKEIGIKLKQLRKARKLTQEAVAEKVGITRSTISNYEICRRTPHLKDLQKLAAVYGVGLDYFGLVPADDTFDLLSRAQEVFESEEVSAEAKEELYLNLTRVYISMKDCRTGGKKNANSR